MFHLLDVERPQDLIVDLSHLVILLRVVFLLD